MYSYEKEMSSSPATLFLNGDFSGAIDAWFDMQKTADVYLLVNIFTNPFFFFFLT